MIRVAISNNRPASASFLRSIVISGVVRIIPVIVRGEK
jgi:hypothetical protein